MNRDGWLDVVVANSGSSDRVYMNLGYDRFAIWAGTPNAGPASIDGHAVTDSATGTKTSIALGI